MLLKDVIAARCYCEMSLRDVIEDVIAAGSTCSEMRLKDVIVARCCCCKMLLQDVEANSCC